MSDLSGHWAGLAQHVAENLSEWKAIYNSPGEGLGLACVQSEFSLHAQRKQINSSTQLIAMQGRAIRCRHQEKPRAQARRHS